MNRNLFNQMYDAGRWSAGYINVNYLSFYIIKNPAEAAMTAS